MWGSILKKLIFPPRCAVCGEVLTTLEWDGFLCTACAKRIPYLSAGKCPHCHMEMDGNGFCGHCLNVFSFSFACGAFAYATVRKAIHLYKYDGGKGLSVGMGTLMAEYLKEQQGHLLEQTDVMLSVPLHPKKEKRRGFDQTELLCRQIAAQTGLLYLEDGLRRTRDTVAQSILNPEERKENLKNVFEAAIPIEGKRVLLIDDIFTTGTTCNECAKALLRAGAESVSVCCLAVTGAESEEDI
mgnify:CR=1 FL=1